MRKVRVLHVIKTLNLGGAESNLCNLVEAFDPKAVKCHVAYSCGGPYERVLRERGVRLFCYDTKSRKVKSPASILIVLKLAAYVLWHRIQVIHTHNYNAHVWGVLAGRLTGAKVLEHVHDSRYEPNALLRDRGLPETSQFDQAGMFAKLSDRIAVLTQANLEHLVSNGIVPAAKIRLVLNGIPLDVKNEIKRDLRKEFGLPEGKKIVFTAMRLSAEKNAEMIIGIASLLRERNDVIFMVAGDGPQKQQLEQKVKDRGLDQKVLFIGFRAEIRELLAISDIFILPTLRELHSLSMIEAMSMRVPVLVSMNAGCNETFVADGVNGFLLDPRFAEEWASTIKSLIEDPELRRRIGEAGRKLVEQKCDIKKIANDFSNTYRELCGV